MTLSELRQIQVAARGKMAHKLPPGTALLEAVDEIATALVDTCEALALNETMQLDEVRDKVDDLADKVEGVENEV